MLLKVGATDLVLRMVEAGTVMRDLTLENPIRAIRDVSHDMTGRRRVRLANGREASALDIQREYLAKAKDFAERRGADAVTQRVLDLWERTLHAVESGDFEPGRPGNRLGHQVPADRALPGQARPAAVLARGWPSSTSPTTTCTAAGACTTCCRRAGRWPGSRGTSTSSRPSRSRRRPPGPGCAASSSGGPRRRRRDFTVDWVHLKLNDQAQRTVLCKDPFRSVDERVEKLIAGM